MTGAPFQAPGMGKLAWQDGPTSRERMRRLFLSRIASETSASAMTSIKQPNDETRNDRPLLHIRRPSRDP